MVHSQKLKLKKIDKEYYTSSTISMAKHLKHQLKKVIRLTQLMEMLAIRMNTSMQLLSTH
jgi:hypothetical protein